MHMSALLSCTMNRYLPGRTEAKFHPITSHLNNSPPIPLPASPSQTPVQSAFHRQPNSRPAGGSQPNSATYPCRRSPAFAHTGGG
jgi:hypothetical protein